MGASSTVFPVVFAILLVTIEASAIEKVSARHLLEECEPCTDNSECEQGKCWGKPSLCTDGTPPSLKRCFKDECESCTSNFQCSTMKCWKKKCVFNTIESMQKCFPSMVFKKRECEPCTDRDECKQGKCWGGKCTDGTQISLDKCFAPECFPCAKDTECSTMKCWAGRCVFDNDESMKKCFPV